MSETIKRTPDDILNAIKISSKKPNGRLKIFLGMCAGVGKTYSMLEAAKNELAKKKRVCIGLIETHGRVETEALLQGLEILPKREIDYKGTKFYEMDVDLILNEHPDIAIIDELAHSNIPGSRHEKRYQDVEEILSAGIDVFTTLNIQHIESRNDIVARIIGVKVTETVPDSFLDLANEIELIDLPVPDLIQRLNDGKVYFEEKISSAKDNFFKEENLSALREIALRFLAEKVNKDLQIHMVTKGLKPSWNLEDVLLVPLMCTSDDADVIRITRLMSEKLNAAWIALYVATDHILTEQEKNTLERNIALARELGGEILSVTGVDIVETIKKICYSKNITQIITKRSNATFPINAFKENQFLARTIKNIEHIDIHIVHSSTQSSTFKFLPFQLPRFTAQPKKYLYTLVYIVCVSLLCKLLSTVINYHSLGSIFLLAVIIFSLIGSFGSVVLTSVSFSLIWDYFFIPPKFSFFIFSQEDQVLFVSFFIVALVVSIFIHRIKKKESLISQQELETRTLYEMVKKLSIATNSEDVCKILSSTIKNVLNFESNIFLLDKNQHLTITHKFIDTIAEKDTAVAEWVLRNAKHAGWSTKTLAGSPCLCMPLKGKLGMLGVICLYPQTKITKLEFEKQTFLETILTQSAIVLERMN